MSDSNQPKPGDEPENLMTALQKSLESIPRLASTTRKPSEPPTKASNPVSNSKQSKQRCWCANESGDDALCPIHGCDSDARRDAKLVAMSAAGRKLAAHWGHEPWSASWARLVAETMLEAAEADA